MQVLSSLFSTLQQHQELLEKISVVNVICISGVVAHELHALPGAEPDGEARHPSEADDLLEELGVAAQVDAPPQLGLARGAAP